MRHIIPLTAIFLVVASIALAAAASDDVLARASADRKRIFIGDRIIYTIEVSSRKKVEVQFPKFADFKLGDFEIKDSGMKTTGGLFGKRAVKGWYEITAYSIGKRSIPQLEISYRVKGEKDWQAKKINPVEITVESILPKGKKPADIKDIKPIRHLGRINWTAFLVGLGIFGILVSGLIAYKRQHRKRPLRLPHETALEELEKVRADFLKTGGIKEYYIGVSDCVRRYIEKRFGLKAPEMTTEEFLNSLKRAAALSVEHKGLLREFLEACDFVKFARYEPVRKEAEYVYTKAKDFIEETKLPAAQPGSKR